MWVILVLLFFAVLGAAIGIIIKNSRFIGYNVSNQIGKKHMEYMGVEDENKDPHRWDE